jgi:anti-sigma factor RsiW
MNTCGPMAKFCTVPREENDMEPHDRTEKCKEVFSLLSEYLNLELPPDACQEIETHLAGCPPCIEFAESLRKTVDLCRRYQPTELPEPLGKNAREQLLDAYQRMLGARKSASS